MLPLSSRMDNARPRGRLYISRHIIGGVAIAVQRNCRRNVFRLSGCSAEPTAFDRPIKFLRKSRVSSSYHHYKSPSALLRSHLSYTPYHHYVVGMSDLSLALSCFFRITRGAVLGASFLKRAVGLLYWPEPRYAPHPLVILYCIRSLERYSRSGNRYLPCEVVVC